MWTLSIAFTSAFKELDPIPQFRATGKLGTFLEAVIPNRRAGVIGATSRLTSRTTPLCLRDAGPAISV